MPNPSSASRLPRTVKPLKPSESTEGVSQYTVDVGGLFQLSRLRIGSRTRPVRHYRRRLPSAAARGSLLVETGALYYVRRRRALLVRGGSATGRALGIRAEARWCVGPAAIDFEDSSRGYPVFSVLGFVGFLALPIRKRGPVLPCVGRLRP